MDFARIVGIASPEVSYRSVALESDTYLGEFHTMVFQPSSVLGAKERVPHAQARRILTKLDEVSAWVSQGHTIIVVLSRVLDYYFQRNDMASSARSSVDILRAPFFQGTQFVAVSGSRIQHSQTRLATQAFFEPFIDSMQYEYIVRKPGLTPLLEISSANPKVPAQIVGGYFPFGNGRVILVPPLSAAPSSATQGHYFDALPNLPPTLVEIDRSLPAWVSNWQTADEKQKRHEVVNRQAQISALQSEIQLRYDAIENDRWLMDLFAETGDAFVFAVKKAFIELGLIAIDGPPPRADVLLRYGDALGAVEVKGLEGSAKEANLRQAEKWVAEVNHALADPTSSDPDLYRYTQLLTELGIVLDEQKTIDTKGIMVIGTFRKTPLDERTQPDYPDQLLRPLSRSNICAITGLQLFAIIMETRLHPEKKKSIANEIFQTSGIFPNNLAWDTYITKTVANETTVAVATD